MPAALRGERRAPVRPSARTSPQGAKLRVSRPVSSGPSKLRVASGAGLSLRLGLTAGALFLVLSAAVALATGGRGKALVGGVTQAFHSRFASLGFRVGSVHLQGASPAAQDEILQAAGIRLGAPIFDVDLAAVRGRVEKVGWVDHAKVIRLLPATLVIAVEQRPLMALWQHDGRFVVITADGAAVSRVDARVAARLPRVVGEGANAAAHPLISLIEAWPALGARLSAMVRVDDRRGDLRLKDGGTILLPAGDEAGGLKRLERLDQTTKILQLGFARIDLRDPGMLVVRPKAAAAATPVVARTGT